MCNSDGVSSEWNELYDPRLILKGPMAHPAPFLEDDEKDKPTLTRLQPRTCKLTNRHFCQYCDKNYADWNPIPRKTDGKHWFATCDNGHYICTSCSVKLKMRSPNWNPKWLSRRGGDNRWQYLMYRLDYCEGIDGRINELFCTSTIVAIEQLTVDHIKENNSIGSSDTDPLKNHPHNLQTLCPICHSNKNRMVRRGDYQGVKKMIYVNWMKKRVLFTEDQLHQAVMETFINAGHKNSENYIQ